MRRYRHKKRGTTYELIGGAVLQKSSLLRDEDPMAVYRSEDDGRLWVRSYNEFYDGRFEEIEPRPAEDRDAHVAERTKALISEAREDGENSAFAACEGAYGGEMSRLRAAADAMAEAVGKHLDWNPDEGGSVHGGLVSALAAYRALSPGERIEPQTVNPGVPV